MNSNNIVPIVRDDFEDILSLQKAAFMVVAKLMNKYDIPPLLQTIEDVRHDYESCTILKYVSADNRIIGSIRGNIYDGDSCHVGKLIVHPDYQNQGIGKALMFAIENYFPTCHKFTLFTSEETPNTVYLYSRIGYQVVYKKEVDGIEWVYMEKLLNL